MIITRNFRTVSVENVNCFFFIIHKQFLHGFPFLYISLIEGGQYFCDLFGGVRIMIYSPTPKQNATNFINS